MSEQDRHEIQMPPGCPDWITPDDIEETIRVWQPRSETPLTPDDAVEILVNVRQLLRLMYGYDDNEKRPQRKRGRQN